MGIITKWGDGRVREALYRAAHVLMYSCAHDADQTMVLTQVVGHAGCPAARCQNRQDSLGAKSSLHPPPYVDRWY